MINITLKHGYQTPRTMVRGQFEHRLRVKQVHAIRFVSLLISSSCQSDSMVFSFLFFFYSLFCHLGVQQFTRTLHRRMQIRGEGPRLRATNRHYRSLIIACDILTQYLLDVFRSRGRKISTKMKGTEFFLSVHRRTLCFADKVSQQKKKNITHEHLS